MAEDGFVANQPMADRFYFAKPSGGWKVVQSSEMGQTVLLESRKLNPLKLNVSLTAPGFSLYWNAGFQLNLHSTVAPYLSWPEGSVTKGIPTPDSKWVLVSFKDNQPAVVLGFPQHPCGLKVEGRPGAWKIVGPTNYQGWVRVGLPDGLRGNPANSASSLGRLSALVSRQEKVWTALAPTLLSCSVQSDSQSVTAAWHFDRNGSTIPTAAQFASLGGYPLRILSPTQDASLQEAELPVRTVIGQDLVVRFPVRRVPTGRGLAIGEDLSPGITSAAPTDIPSVVELGLENLRCGRDPQTQKAGEDTLAEYLLQANYVLEPVSGQQLPFDGAGKGVDLAASHAWLMQCVNATQRATSESNSLLTSLSWRRDWTTWSLGCLDVAIERRGAALAALAGALCSEPERRLDAAMLQAGLAAVRGIARFKKTQGGPENLPVFSEPMFGLRKSLFSLATPGTVSTEFADILFSPLRTYGSPSVSVASAGGKFELRWPALEPKSGILTLAAGYAVQLTPLTNLTRLQVNRAYGFVELIYVPETAGGCRAQLTLPDWAPPLPKAVEPPRYSEAAL